MSTTFYTVVLQLTISVPIKRLLKLDWTIKMVKILDLVKILDWTKWLKFWIGQ